MGKSIGKALEKAIKTENEVELQTSGQAIFHPARLAILEYLTKRPCSHQGLISKDLSVARATIRWHTRILSESNYLASKSMGNKLIYIPSNYMDVADIQVLSILRQDEARAMFTIIFNDPGLSTGEISDKVEAGSEVHHRKLLNDLVSNDLVSILKDGRTNRYYPTSLLQKKREQYETLGKHFLSGLIKRFQADSIDAEIAHSSGQKVVLRLGFKGKKHTMNISTNPFIAIFNKYLD